MMFHAHCFVDSQRGTRMALYAALPAVVVFCLPVNAQGFGFCEFMIAFPAIVMRIAGGFMGLEVIFCVENFLAPNTMVMFSLEV